MYAYVGPCLLTNNRVQITAVSLSVRHHLAAHTTVKAVRFITNYLLPPPKRAVLAHLGIPLATGELVKDEDRILIVRKAEVDVSYVCRAVRTDVVLVNARQPRSPLPLGALYFRFLRDDFTV